MARVNKEDLKIGITFTRCSDCERVEVVHGEWLRTDDTYPVFECSNCKRTDNYKRNYCPNCGAKMDKGE